MREIPRASDLQRVGRLLSGWISFALAALGADLLLELAALYSSGEMSFARFATSLASELLAVAVLVAVLCWLRPAVAGFGRAFHRFEQVEEERRRAEERYRSIVENAGEGIFQTSADGSYITANPALARIYGYASPAELMENVTDVERQIYVEPRRRQEFVRELQERDRVSNFESRVFRRDGSMIWISENARAVRDEAGQLLHYEGTVVDITARKRAEEEIRVRESELRRHRDHLEDMVHERTVRLHRANEALEREVAERKRAEQLKDELVSTVSHELRTPLASLRGFTELLLHREFPRERQQEFLRIIHEESLRLGRLIDNFLDLQRMEAGRQPYELVATDLASLLHEAVTLFGLHSSRHRIVVEVEDALPMVRADGDRIRQVLANLLSNAVKFSPDGGEVRVRARCEGARVVVSVSDRGIGIEPEALDGLFRKFHRLPNAEAHGIGGTGLGLALVREIVEAHGGRVEVASRLGEGSTFGFALPVAPEVALAAP